MHYSLRPSRGNRLPLITVTGLNKLHTHGVTALHYGSCAPLSTLRLQPHDCNPKTRYQLPAKLYWAMDLHHGYTMYAELAHLDLGLIDLRSLATTKLLIHPNADAEWSLYHLLP